MAIDPINSMSLLRLVRPAQEIGPSAPVAPAAPTSPAALAQRAQQADSYSFEAMYRSQLPIVDVAEARARLEQIRNELVAARVDMPVHFDASPAARSANPYAASYMKLTPSAADLNAAATELHDAD